MDQELTTYYEEQFSMMATQGWSDLIKHVEKMLERESNIMAIRNEEELFKRQGRIDILLWLKNWKSVCEATYLDIQNETNV